MKSYFTDARYLDSSDSCVDRRLRNTNRIIEALVFISMDQWVYRLLLQMSFFHEGMRIVEKRFIHQEIADRVDSSGELAGCVLKRLSETGEIRMTGKKFQLLSRPLHPP